MEPLFIYTFDLKFEERGRTHMCGSCSTWVEILAKNEQQAREELTMHVITQFERRVEYQDIITTTLRETKPIKVPGVIRYR